MAKQLGRESCVSDIIRGRPLQTHTSLFTAMADSCSSSSEEEHVILLDFDEFSNIATSNIVITISIGHISLCFTRILI